LRSPRAFALAITTSIVLVLPSCALAQNGSGGAAFPTPTPIPTPPAPAPAPTNIVVPGALAQLLPDGTAAAPADAPPQVQQAIFAANLIQDRPYIYGGGHKSFDSKGYDCSGTVSYALHGGGLLDAPLDSGSFMSWGDSGPGQWITIFTNPGHAYAVIAGLRLDTSAAAVTRATKAQYKKALESGPRWRPTQRSSHGFKKRHPVGF
jgi:cell wall-associated NlpC family hydrolase